MSLVYRCSVCKKTYESDVSNEEAEAKKNQIFGSVPINQCSIVCDDCFKKMNHHIPMRKWMEKNYPEYL